MLQKVGQDFSTSICLNLLPGIDLSGGIYQIYIQYTTDVGGITTMHSIVQNTSHENLNVIFGKDVRNVSFQISEYYSSSYNSKRYYEYNMRVDRLILLNLAYKLLKDPSM